MRRAGLVLVCILFASCRLKPPEVPAQEVLKRAALASQKLQSADFTMTANGVLKDKLGNPLWKVSVRSSGSLGDRGQSAAAALQVAAQAHNRPTTYSLSASGHIVSQPSGDLFIRPDAVLEQPVATALTATFTPLLGRWWRIEQSSSGSYTRSVIPPDPNWLLSQTQALRVTHDFGIQPLASSSVRHLSVAANPDVIERLIHSSADADDQPSRQFKAHGELWIDAENWYLRRAVWSLEMLAAKDVMLQATVTVALTNHDHGRAVVQPRQSMRLPFNLDNFTTISSGSLLPQTGKTGDTPANKNLELQ